MMMATPIKSSFVQLNQQRAHDNFRTPLMGTFFENENSMPGKDQKSILDKNIIGALASSR
jgi:hypothetical protein